MNLHKLAEKLHAEFKYESGQGLAEYVLVIFLLAIALVAAISGFSSALVDLYITIQAAIP